MVPPALVYFVKFCSMARMAARLILSGVGKSGSPAPKSTTSTPCVRSFSASAATRIVDDTLMAEMRSAISCLACTSISFPPTLLMLSSPKSLLQPDFYRRRHQPGDVAAQREDFLHQPRADE